MDPLPCAWTVHEVATPKLATTPALPSRQGTLPLCPVLATSTSGTMQTLSFFCHSPHKHATRKLTCHNDPADPPKTSPHSFARSATPDPIPEQNPFKDPASHRGLVHCTASSLSLR